MRKTQGVARSLFLVGVAFSTVGHVHLAIAAGPPKPKAMVALTFDDLPAHSSLPPGVTRTDVARSILAALKLHHAPPTYGFVNAKALDGADTAEVLRLWRAAGNPLANHGFSHMDLNANTAEAFEQDILADEATLRAQMGDHGWRWLRYPFLHEGDTLEKRRAVRSFLADRGYRVAQVTMNFDDYAYNEPYARCVAKNDEASITALKESYLRRAGESLTFAQQAATLVFDRDIAHVMLLHIGAFETVMFPKLLDLLEQRGFHLVTLEEAQKDAAYAGDPDPPLPSGGTLLGQWMAAKHLTPPAHSDEDLGRISGFCR